MEVAPVAPLEIHPLTADRWADLESLFGERGVGGCWCMWWRLPNRAFSAGRGDGNRAALRTLATEGTPSGLAPGLIGYADGLPVGWISLGPRAEYGRFAVTRATTTGPVDDAPVWSIVCFFTRAGWRRRGVSRQMLDAAIAWARDHGAHLLEAYASEVTTGVAASNVYMGTKRLFDAAGFVEVARNRPDRPIMRLALHADAPSSAVTISSDQ